MADIFGILAARLKAMHDEIEGVTAFETLPTILSEGEYPCIYPVDQGFRDDDLDDQATERVYSVTIEIPVAKIYEDQVDSSVLSKAYADTLTVKTAVVNYYDQHRKLTTSTLAAPGYIIRPMTVIAEGFKYFRPVNQEEIHAGTIIQLSIPVKTSINAKPHATG